MTPEIIYVVRGCAGEYDDFREWSVKAFRSEASARDLVTKAQARAKELTSSDLANGKKNEHDPNMSLSYTGASYFIEKLKLLP